MRSLPRVVLYGPPLAGKQTLLETYATSRDARLERFKAPCGTEAVSHWIARLEIDDLRMEMITIPGAVWNMDAWWTFLPAAAAVALVLDGQEARENADREHIDALMGMTLPAVRCVIFTKEDLIAKGAVGRVSAALLDDGRLAGWQTFRTRNDQPHTLVEPIEWLLRQLPAGASPP